MKETHLFLMPDYYVDFACKMGACRTPCCEGWPISISMQNYFYLVGIDCDRELRWRLDCGLRVADHPTKEEYARFEPRYDGRCPMHMPDGRCGLHAYLGEGVLPDVCRLYPRGLRAEDGMYECSCANSCEAVVEMLMEREAPLRFDWRELTVQLPPSVERTSFFETLGMEQRIRLHLIEVMQDRSMPLPTRILCVGDLLDRMDAAMKAQDATGLERVLCLYPKVHGEARAVEREHLRFGLEIAEQMMQILDGRSQSVRAFGEEALGYFGDGEGALERYVSARTHFEELFPTWEIFFEQLLVNHMFFTVFPFQDRPESMHSEYVALCAVYTLLRFLALGVMATRTDKSDLVDVMASAFRLVDHTEFDRYASHLLTKLHCTSPEELWDLISL
ncbi:MAG: flagellin lysine-N-methylase [Clostridia bacterium]|nr:flagellin lysine-N-methylase [Clostridia bacterium]